MPLGARALQHLVCCPAGTLKCLHCKRTMPGRGDATHGPPLCADCAAEEGAAARVWLVGARTRGRSQQRVPVCCYARVKRMVRLGARGEWRARPCK